MITLWKANELPKDDPLSKFAMPKGFPFLVVESDESIEIQEHVLLYLHEKFVRGKGRRGWEKIRLRRTLMTCVIGSLFSRFAKTKVMRTVR